MRQTRILTTAECHAHALEHGEIYKGVHSSFSPGFVRLHTEMKVFKKTRDLATSSGVITNLVIPVGALIYIPSKNGGAASHNRKMRASEAYVHSSFTVHQAEWSCDHSILNVKPYPSPTSVRKAASAWDNSFKYVAGKLVKPVREFEMKYGQCESGIHFYINLSDALWH